MQTVTLPLFTPADSVESALSALREHGVGAVVLVDGGSTSIIYGGTLAVARHEHRQTLAQVQEREAVPQLEQRAATMERCCSWLVDVRRIHRGEPGRSALLDDERRAERVR